MPKFFMSCGVLSESGDPKPLAAVPPESVSVRSPRSASRYKHRVATSHGAKPAESRRVRIVVLVRSRRSPFRHLKRPCQTALGHRIPPLLTRSDVHEIVKRHLPGSVGLTT